MAKEEKMSEQDKKKAEENEGSDRLTLIAGGLAGVLLTMVVGGLLPSCHQKIPRNTKVQQGYVAPSDLEITCVDRDHTDGQNLPETYVRIKDKQYLLRMVDGKPILSLYNVKPAVPAEVVPRE